MDEKFADEWLHPKDYRSISMSDLGDEESYGPPPTPPPPVRSFTSEFASQLTQRKKSDDSRYPETLRKLGSLGHLASMRRVHSMSSGGRENLRVRFKMDAEDKSPPLLFNPQDPFIIRWRNLEVVFLSISFFRLPMVIAFGAQYLIWDIVPEMYFVFDHILALNTGFYHKDNLVMDRGIITARWFDPEHFKTGDRRSVFVFMMEFLPFYTCLAIMHYIQTPFWILSLCSLPRGRRIYDLLIFFYQRERDLTKDVRWTALFKYTLAMLGSGHWFACLWWLLARVSGFSPTSWLQQYLSAIRRTFDFDVGGSLYSYSISLLWGYSTLSGIGYLGYLPTTTLESIFFVGMTLLSVLVHSFLFGILLHYIVRKDVAQEKYKSMMDQVEKYSALYSLPRKLEDAIKLFYTFQYKKKVGSDEEVMQAIPIPLKMKIMVHQYHKVAEDRVFLGCQEQFVSTVLSLLKPKILIPGTQIYLKDDVSREVCFIERGEVEVHDDSDVHVGILKGTAACFPAVGEISFFLGIPQVYTFTASKNSEVKLLTLSKEDYEEVKDRFPDARDILINNVRSLVSLGKEGDEHDSQLLDINKESSIVELRMRVKKALRTKLDDDVATMFNAIRDGYYDEVKLLLSKGFNPNATDYDKRTSLHFAAVAGDDKIVDLLLQHGADIHMRDRWGRNAFQDAVDNNHRKVIQQLATQGAELKLENAAGRLCSAAFADNLFELQHLVENGIDANSADYDGRTALHLSACEGNSKIVEFLLLPMSKGDPNVTDRWGASPLLDAIKHGNQAVAHILYENGGRLSIERAATFLCTAAAEGDCPMLRLLSECGVDTNIGDYDNRYPIHLAAAEGEVVSVHFLTYAHADISVKDRWGRTPLDDAITGGFWMCAKLLLGFGAEHTVEVTSEAQEQLDKTSMEAIRALVRAEKVLQHKRKDTEKQLRDNVKWMMADSDTWLKHLDERMEGLDRVIERYMGVMEDPEQCIREAGLFLEQRDADILVSERPQGDDLGHAARSNKEMGKDYLLSRFFKETRSSPTRHGKKSLKSMQHFFLKLGMIEKGMDGFKRRVREKSGAISGKRAKIGARVLGEVLKSYGLDASKEELQHYLSSCTKGKDVDEDSVHKEDLLGLYESSNNEEAECRVSFDDLLTSRPLWKMIADASPGSGQEGEDLKELQEAVQCIFQGFALMDSNHNGKLTRTEWRVMKRQEDLGDFASEIDKFFEKSDQMGLEVFFLLVAFWANFEDDEEDGVLAWLGGQSANATDCTQNTIWQSSPCSTTREERTSAMKERIGIEMVPPLAPVHGPKDLPKFESVVEFDRVDGYGTDIADQPNANYQDMGFFRRLRLVIRFRSLERRLARRAAQGLMASTEDLSNRFDRLDVLGRGALDETRTQLLLSWAFDLDLKLEDWDAVFYHLAGEKSCLVRREAIVTWTESLLKLRPRQKSQLISCLGSFRNSAQIVVDHMAGFPNVIDHQGRFARFWKALEMTTVLYMFLSVPYQIAFLRHDLLGRYFSSLAASWGFDLLMLLDIVVKFNTSFVDEHSLQVFDRARIRNRYLQTDFVLDFVGVIPLDILAAYYSQSKGGLVAFLRIPKLVHTHRLYSHIRRQITERSSSSARLMADIQFLYCVSVAVIHILACIWYYMTEGQPGYERVSAYTLLGDPTRGDDDGGPFAIRYYIYCCGVMVYVVAVNGLPGVISGSIQEVLFLVGCIVLNLSFWTYLMGSISGLFVSMDEKVAESHEQMSSCVRFIKQNNIPFDLGQELKNFFSLDANQKGSLNMTDQNRVYRSLPQSLQVQLARHISRDLLVQVDIFRNTSDYFLDAVSTLLQVEVIASGEHLYKEGSVCRSLIIIASGTVETVTLDREKWNVLGTHEAGEALGQLEFCLDTRYMTSARVASSGGDILRIFRLHKEDYARVVKLYPKDEDVIHHNIACLSEDEKHETASTVRSAFSSVSMTSLESGLRSLMDDNQLERAMADIDKAKLRSQEQRVRAFFNAAVQGNMDVLSRLVNSGVDVNGRDTNGRTALMLATCSGNMEVIKYLFYKGADPNLRDNFGGSALLDAMKGNHIDVMAFLKDQGAVLQLEDAAGTLCLLAAEGKTDQLRLLLDLGADPNVADYDKRTALHTAASEGHLGCVKLLIEYWADVNPIDRMKGTPLTDSVRHGHLDVQKFLRERGGRLIIDPVELGTTLCEAAATGDLQKIQILAENGANINQGDYDGRTALHLAACCNKLSVIEYLVNIPGINMNPLDRCCCTPYDDALRENQRAIASILQMMGGLKGTDPQLEEAQRAHRHAREEHALKKAARRDEKMVLFKRQVTVLDRLLEIYHTMSEHLPPLFKYMNLLSVTLRSRRNTSVVDRTPHPSLYEVRTYFCMSFHQYLEQRYMKKFDNFLTLCEEYASKQRIQDRGTIAEKIFTSYLDPQARGYIHMDPGVVRACRDRYREGVEQGRLPRDLLESLETFVKHKLESILSAYFVSREFYGACRKQNGFLWRVIKLGRLADEHCSVLLDKVISPMLEMGDNGDLHCVPHVSPHSRAKFRDMIHRFDQHLVRLKKNLHVICYLSKDAVMREQIKEGHTAQAIGHAKAASEEAAGIKRKNL